MGICWDVFWSLFRFLDMLEGFVLVERFMME